MNNYKELAIRYLKMNKKRSIITIMGVTVVVTVLYTILNLGWSALLGVRESIRESEDYEIVLFTESKEQIDQIMSDERVKSGYIGTYSVYDYEEPKTYDNALYINTINPYRMDSIFKKLSEKYGVEGDFNEDLEVTYLQGDEINMIFVSFLTVLLISYIFAIFGIGIIRNSIQLSTLEQIKDYGNLRCVGATKGQLKTIVYLEGTILELTGNIIGILLGWFGSMIAGYFLRVKVGFLFVPMKVGLHFVPVVPILVAFLGDLYFAMEENCKVIVNLTPVSAIRGEYRIRKEKIKVRRKSIFGMLFGVEGDYAYKNIMRNPGRFHKTVWAIGIGVAAFITIMGVISTVYGPIEKLKEKYRYYNVYYEHTLSTNETIDVVQSSLPPANVLQKISDMDEAVEAKRMYSSMVMLADWESYFEHYTEEFLNQTGNGQRYQHRYGQLKGDNDVETQFSATVSPTGLAAAKRDMTEICCYGYDEEDYTRFQSVLVDGTLDISESGLVLINSDTVSVEADAITEDTLFWETDMEVEFTDYKVGDTIDIVDMKRLRSMVDKEMEAMQHEVKNEEAEDSGWNEAEYLAKLNAVERCWQKLVEEGAYKTYTIEGIVSENVNYYGGYWNRERTSFILPLEKYYSFTGTDETMVTGMQYHFDKFPAGKFFEIIRGDEFFSEYAEYMYLLESFKNVAYGVLTGVMLVVMVSTINIINTTASNLHLRRKEFAQLRVIGVSKKQLMKMVMLEGVISSIVANIIGIIFGIIINGVSFQYILIVLGIKYRFPFFGVFLGLLFSTLVLCGSVYVPLRKMKSDMAGDLAMGGD